MAGSVLLVALTGCSATAHDTDTKSPGVAAAALGGTSTAVLPEIPSTGCGRVISSTVTDRRHLKPGETFHFTAFPVAGGPHDPNPLPAGTYAEPFPDLPSGASGPSRLRAVHSLEHGYVEIYYSALPPAQVQSLVHSFGGTTKVIISPTPDLPSPIQLVAWGRVRNCASVDAHGIQEFLDAYRAARSAPEPNGP